MRVRLWLERRVLEHLVGVDASLRRANQVVLLESGYLPHYESVALVVLIASEVPSQGLGVDDLRVGLRVLVEGGSARWRELTLVVISRQRIGSQAFRVLVQILSKVML